MPVRAVFFDAAGTLLHPARPVGHVYAEVAAPYGVRADPDLIHAAFKSSWKAMRAEALAGDGRVASSKAWWKEVVLRTWQVAPLPGAFPFDTYYGELFAAFARPELWRIFPEVEGVLNAMRKAGLRCGVLSNWDERLRPVLLGHGLNFDDLIISGEVGWEKPAPEIFRIAEKAFGIEANEAFLIGDDPILDGEGARAAGWHVCLVKRPEETLEKSLVMLRELGLAL